MIEGAPDEVTIRMLLHIFQHRKAEAKSVMFLSEKL